MNEEKVMGTYKAEDWRTMRRKIIRSINRLRKGPQRDLGIERWAPLQRKVRRFTRKEWVAGKIN
jgi:hypothetical protein